MMHEIGSIRESRHFPTPIDKSCSPLLQHADRNRCWINRIPLYRAWLGKLRSHLFACALSTTVAMAAPVRADDDKALRFVPHADLAIIDPYFSGVYLADA
jgi:hypothetical protein